MEDVELLVDLQKLEGATSSPPLLLRLAVVDVPLVFGGLAHGDEYEPDPGEKDGRRRRWPAAAAAAAAAAATCLPSAASSPNNTVN